MSIPLRKLNDQYFASCPLGLEVPLENELKNLGVQIQEVVKRGVNFKATTEQALKIVFHSRIASRLFLKTFNFKIKNEKELYFGIKEINWKRFFDPHLAIKVIVTRSTTDKRYSKFQNTLYLSQVIKDGICDRFKKDNLGRPDVDLKNPDVIINCHLRPSENPHSQKSIATILIDFTGEPLCNRGYRVKDAKAPVRENIAAGIIDLLEWKGDENFIDLTCGSGTFLIEAYIKAKKIPASFMKLNLLQKNEHLKLWNFQKLNIFKSAQNRKAIQKEIKNSHKLLEESKSKKLDCLFHGNDIHYRTVMNLKEDLRYLGWQEDIKVTSVDARDFADYSTQKNLLFSNPPYGKRLDEERSLEDLYYELGENFKNNFKKSRLCVFSANREMLKRISLKHSKKHIISHGSLDCRLVEYLNF